jgi:hypothetical protein
MDDQCPHDHRGGRVAGDAEAHHRDQRRAADRVVARLGRRDTGERALAESLRVAVEALVVAFEPDFKKIFELAVLGDVAWRKMAMKIQNWFLLGKLMIQPPRSCGGQQKIFVNETHWQN